MAIDLLDPNDIMQFLSDQRIIYACGSVHSHVPTKRDVINLTVAEKLGDPIKKTDLAEDFEPRKQFLDRCHEASKGLLTIDPHEKQRNVGALRVARNWVHQSEVVYILVMASTTTTILELDLMM
jgi:hypothetical protein